MINNHDIWGLTGIDGTGILTILHIPTVVSNRASDTVIRCFSGTSLGTKLEVDLSTDSLLDAITMVEPVHIDSHDSILTPPNIIMHKKRSNE